VISGIVDRIIRRVLRKAFTVGVLEGSGTWIIAGAAALLARLLWKPERPKVQRERLALGETIVLTHRLPEPSGRHRARSRG
jgi:hypothetical protein